MPDTYEHRLGVSEFNPLRFQLEESPLCYWSHSHPIVSIKSVYEELWPNVFTEFVFSCILMLQFSFWYIFTQFYDIVKTMTKSQTHTNKVKMRHNCKEQIHMMFWQLIFVRIILTVLKVSLVELCFYSVGFKTKDISVS